MKKYSLLALFWLSFLVSFAQTFTTPRTSPSITVQDSRMRPLLNFYLPHTHGLTLNGGLDTLGAAIYEDSSGHIWYRDTVLAGGHKWTMVSTTAGAQFYQTVQNGGVSLTQRSRLNFTAPFLATDNAGNNSSDATVSPNGITNSFLAQMPPHTYKGNNTAGTINAGDITNTQVVTDLGAASPGQRVMTDPASGLLATQAEILHQPVHYGTTAALPANTYNNGTAGVGATLTANGNGALTIDAFQVAIGDRVLVNNEVDSTHNGIYVVTAVGSVSTPYVLARTPYASIGSNMKAGTLLYIDSGTVNKNLLFVQTITGTITFGTSKIKFVQAALFPGKNLSDVTNANTARANLGILNINPLSFGIESTASNAGFFVMATGIMQPTTTYVINQPIGWNFLTTGGHGVSYFTSITAAAGNTIRVSLNYPTCKNVINVSMCNDETTQGHGITIGPTVAFSHADAQASQPVLSGFAIHGNGTTSWVTESLNAGISLSVFSTADGGTSFNVTDAGSVFTDYYFVPITYVGPNKYSIQKTYSGLGSFGARFNIIDNAGGYLSTNPTATDHIVIGPAIVDYQNVNLQTYNLYNSWLQTGQSTNFWVLGIFECYLVANPLSTSSINVRWQDYLGDSVQVYRATDSTFASRTLVATSGPGGGEITDNGLTTNTQYFYQFNAKVAGTFTPITWFPCPTNQF